MSGHAGQVTRAPMSPRNGRSRMWQTMRVMRRFTVADLMATAEVGESAARKYVRGLKRAEYLRCVREQDAGRTGGHALYQLVRNSGPHAPRIGNQAVRDPNLESDVKLDRVSIPRREYERALRCIRLCELLRAHADTASLRKRAAAALEVAR